MSKKLFSKFIVLLLVVGLLFAAAPTMQAQAQTTVSTWDGTYPAEKPTDMPAVSGGVQEVTTAAQFAWLASQTDMFPAGFHPRAGVLDDGIARDCGLTTHQKEPTVLGSIPWACDRSPEAIGVDWLNRLPYKPRKRSRGCV